MNDKVSGITEIVQKSVKSQTRCTCSATCSLYVYVKLLFSAFVLVI